MMTLASDQASTANESGHPHGTQEVATPAEGWGRFVVLVTLLFVARGLFLLAVLPPLEGWDEYQHLAYIEFLRDHGRAPVLGLDSVPPAVLTALDALPQPKAAVEQLRSHGWMALGYEEYFRRNGPRALPAQTPLPLYEAQQGPLYYSLAVPVFDAFGGLQRPLATVAALRLANLGLAGATILVFAYSLRRLFGPTAEVKVATLLLALNPIYLLNSVRVASDALSTALSVAAVALALVPVARGFVGRTLVAGLLLGTASAAKATALGVLPLLAIAVIACGRRLRLTSARVVGLIVLLGLSFAGPLVPLGVENYRHYGVPIVTQEALARSGAAHGFWDALKGVARFPWLMWSGRVFVVTGLWVGGWTFSRLPAPFYGVFGLLLVACAVGLVRRMALRGRRSDPALDRALTWVFALGCALAASGLAYHGLLSQLAWGRVETNGWYMAPCLPWLSYLLVRGALGLPWRSLAVGVTVGLGGLFIAAELVGTFFVMIPQYASTSSPFAAWFHLAALHPEALNPFVGAAAMTLAIVSLIAIASRLVPELARAVRSTPSSKPGTITG